MTAFINAVVTFLGLHFRKKRSDFFKSLFVLKNKKIKILDVGGTQEFWKSMGFNYKNCSVTILNLSRVKVALPNFKSVIGDARAMKLFDNKEFDVVFSNSVIEHLGNWKDQKRMAKEIQRVGKHYFIQTPNYFFPIEPHLLFPFFQFLPLKLRLFLYRYIFLSWGSKTTGYKEAIRRVGSVRLLRKSELLSLFKNGSIFEEKFLGLTKSYIMYK